jgi:predicted RNase H-like HicB family nuclease
MITYAVQFATRYDGLVIATFPDLPGISALGRDDEEALWEARRALEDALVGFERDGVAPPEPSVQTGTSVSVERALPPLLTA